MALFQIGAQVTHMSVLLDGETIYEREQPFGGNQLTQDIVRAYGLSFEEADAKKKAGDLPENYEADLLRPFLENAALEVTRAHPVLLHVDAVHPRRPDVPGRRLRACMPGLLELVAQPHQDLERRGVAVQGHAAGAVRA